MTKKTVGQEAIERQSSKEKINPIDLQQEVHKGSNSKRSFEEEIAVCYARGREVYDGDFFIVVLFKKERLLHNVVRQYFFHRKSCPTPEFDQVVYHYNRKGDELEFLWVVPDKQTYESIVQVPQYLHQEQDELINFCHKFRNGELDVLCAKLNKEPHAID